MQNRQIKILVVDDDDVDRILIGELLSKVKNAQFEFHQASTIEEAQKELNNNQYDVYLTDYFLGNSNGLELVHEAKKVGCDTPIIIITGLDDDNIDNEVIRAGASDYIPKAELSPTLLERTILHAIDRQKEARKLERLVKQDPLTGLANRILFDANLDSAIARSQRHHKMFAVMLLDLDRFKDINDNLGHLIGDKLLICIAERLTSAVRNEDVVGRIGGDEFTFLIENIDSVKTISNIAKKIIKNIEKPIQLEEHELVISGSVGVAIYPQNGKTAKELIKNADLALYQVKNRGRNGFQIFDSSIIMPTTQEKSLQENLQKAILNGQLLLKFEEQQSTDTEKASSFEIVMFYPYNQSEYNLLEAFQNNLIPTAQIIESENWALNKLGEMTQNTTLSKNLKFNIRLSQTMLYHKDFPTILTSCLKKHPHLKGRLSLLLNESTLTNLVESQHHILSMIKSLDISLIFDDFGEGASSLKLINTDLIKTIRLNEEIFATNKLSDCDQILIKNLSAINQNCQFQIIANGIKTSKQKDLAIQLGCNLVQGKFIAEGKSFSQIQALI